MSRINDRGWPAERLAGFFSHLPLPGADEKAIQDGIKAFLKNMQAPYLREFSLSPKDRIDFLVEDRVGVEVKLKGRLVDVVNQLSRYADHPKVEELILVTASMQLAAVPVTLRGKPVFVVNLLRGLR